MQYCACVHRDLHFRHYWAACGLNECFLCTNARAAMLPWQAGTSLLRDALGVQPRPMLRSVKGETDMSMWTKLDARNATNVLGNQQGLPKGHKMRTEPTIAPI